MSFMPNVGTQVRLIDGRIAWVTSFTPRHGEDDRVVFEDGHQEPVDVMTGIAEIIGEEMPGVVLASLVLRRGRELREALPYARCLEGCPGRFGGQENSCNCGWRPLQKALPAQPAAGEERERG